MKKIFFFFFAMLASIAVSATVTVTPIRADYTTKKVTFKVSWTNTPQAPYLNRMWIWIDFCPISGTQPAASFSPASITNPTKDAGNGTISGLNGRGFFITYNTTNSGTTITATLSNAPAGKFNWCAYGSDYPPNVTVNNGTYTFKGTPPFILKDASGNITQTIPDKTLPASSLTTTPVPVTLTDKTGYPGVFCIYTGNDLYIDATHLCQQRTSGAQNWEAWIKDSRDSRIYRITQFSDGCWWFSDDLSTTLKLMVTCSGYSMYNPKDQPSCPNGWAIPTDSQIKSRWPAGPATDTYGATLVGNITYYAGCGAANPGCATSTLYPVWLLSAACGAVWQWDTDGAHECGGTPCWRMHCGNLGATCGSNNDVAGGRVRCFRSL